MDSTIDETILSSFKKFIKFQINSTSLDALDDEIMCSYVINAIKQFYEEYENHKAWIDDNVEESFDMENFIEIIDAYFEGFRELDEAIIIVWLVELKRSLDNKVNIEEKSYENKKSQLSECLEEITLQETEVNTKNVKKKNNLPSVLPDIQNLCEMFPSFCEKNITKVYKKYKHDYNRTLDELLECKDNLIDISSDDSDNEQLRLKNDMTDEEKKIIKEKTVQK